jgi:hypothetical protein
VTLRLLSGDAKRTLASYRVANVAASATDKNGRHVTNAAVDVSYANGLITVTPQPNGTIKGKVLLKVTFDETPNTSAVYLTLKTAVLDAAKATAKAKGFTVSLKGKLDIANPDSAIAATVKLSGTTSEIADVKLYSTKEAYEAAQRTPTSR